MKKGLLLVVCLVSGLALSDVNVNWWATAGFYFNADPNTGILGSGQSTVAQLIYTLSGNVNDALAGGGVSGDNVLWSSITLTEGGNTSAFADFGSQNYTQAFISGFVYARIFETSAANFGDWYYYTTPIELVDIIGPTPPQTIEMNTDLINGNAIDFGSNVAQVIPEPATALLFVLGSMGAWMARRNKMKSEADA